MHVTLLSHSVFSLLYGRGRYYTRNKEAKTSDSICKRKQ